MSSEAHMLCARWFAGFFLTVGFLALFFYLSYCPIPPRYFISHLSLYLSSNTTSRPENHLHPLADFVLEVQNRNKHLGIFHDDLKLDFSLHSNSSSGGGSIVAAAVVPGFYQGHQKTAVKSGTAFNSSSGVRKWPAGVVEVRLLSTVRYKVLAWGSKRQGVDLRGVVEVDGEGAKVVEDPIRLRSGVPRVQRRSVFACVCVIIMTLMLLR